MPPTCRIGPSYVPVEAAGANTRILDPLLVGLLDYFSFWIRLTLNDKLAEVQGPIDSNPILDACPAEHCFPWDHKGTFCRQHKVGDEMKVPLPGLWMWEEGATSTKEGATLWYAATQRTIKMSWVFPELQIPGYSGRSGLANAVSNAILKACDEGRHPDYGYGTDPAGTWILGSLNLHALDFVRGAHGALQGIPNSSVAGNGGVRGSDGAIQRFHPAYEATFQVVEKIEQRQFVLPDDVLVEGTVAINHGEDANDTTLVLERTIPGPDELVP